MRLTKEQYLEIQAYLDKRKQIKELAIKVESKEKLTKIEQAVIINYIDNLNNLINIKGLDRDDKKSIECF